MHQHTGVDVSSCMGDLDGGLKQSFRVRRAAPRTFVAAPKRLQRMAELVLEIKEMDPVQFGKYWDEYEGTAIQLMKLAQEQ